MMHCDGKTAMVIYLFLINNGHWSLIAIGKETMEFVQGRLFRESRKNVREIGKSLEKVLACYL
jgi:hypothetical protein